MEDEPSDNGSCVQISVLITQINDWTHYPYVRFITFAAYALIFIFGMVGNCGIMLGIVRRGDDAKVVANVFLLNLALIDVLLCLIAIPITPVTSIYKEWYFGGFLCKFVPMCQGMAVLITSISLVFIAIDRYRNIVLMTHEPWQFHHAVAIVIASWLFAALVNIPVFNSQVLSNLQQSDPPICGLFCMPQNWVPTFEILEHVPCGSKLEWVQESVTKQMYGSVMLCLQFIIPLLLLFFCYFRILWKVHVDMAVSSVAGASQQQQAAKRKSRVMRILMLMVAAFLVSWLPLSLLNILRDFDVNLGATLYEQLFFFSNLFHFCAMTSVVWNPLLYFWLSKYRRRDVARHIAFNSVLGGSMRKSRLADPRPEDHPLLPTITRSPTYDRPSNPHPVAQRSYSGTLFPSSPASPRHPYLLTNGNSLSPPPSAFFNT